MRFTKSARAGAADKIRSRGYVGRALGCAPIFKTRKWSRRRSYAARERVVHPDKCRRRTRFLSDATRHLDADVLAIGGRDEQTPSRRQATMPYVPESRTHHSASRRVLGANDHGESDTGSGADIGAVIESASEHRTRGRGRRRCGGAKESSRYPPRETTPAKTIMRRGVPRRQVNA